LLLDPGDSPGAVRSDGRCVDGDTRKPRGRRLGPAVADDVVRRPAAEAQAVQAGAQGERGQQQGEVPGEIVPPGADYDSAGRQEHNGVERERHWPVGVQQDACGHAQGRGHQRLARQPVEQRFGDG
jgi:hypothetical protein